MEIPAASGFRSEALASTPLSSPRVAHRLQSTNSSVTLPQANFKPMDVTLKLRSAVYFADATKARVAILAGADVNATNPENHGETMLHTAVLEGNVDIVRLLLEHKAQVNKTNDCGETPLHLACFEENEEISRVLVAFGADPDLEDEDGNTPYEIMNLADPASGGGGDASAIGAQQQLLEDQKEQFRKAVTPRKLLQQQQQQQQQTNAAAASASPSAATKKPTFMRLRVGSSRSPRTNAEKSPSARIRSLNSLDNMGPLASPRRSHGGSYSGAGGGGGGGGGAGAGAASSPRSPVVRTPIRERMRAAAEAAKNEPLPIEVDLIWTMIEGLSAEHKAILKRRLNAD